MKNKQEFELNEIVKKVLSIAKHYGIEELNIPLYDKEFPLIPSLYCSNIKASGKILRDLKEYMDIQLEEGYIYFDDKIEGISEFDDSRYIKVHMLSIKNISKIKYFGIEREITYGYEVLFKKLSNKIEKSILNNITNNFSINNCTLKLKYEYNKQNSYIPFLIAANKVKASGYFLDLTTSKRTHIIDNKFILPSNKHRTVFITEISLKERLKVVK